MKADREVWTKNRLDFVELQLQEEPGIQPKVDALNESYDSQRVISTKGIDLR